MIQGHEPRPVAIHGAPRSGTSWLGQLFNSSEYVAYRYQPLFSHAFRGRLSAFSDVGSLRAFMDDLLHTGDDFVLQRGAAAMAGYELSFEKQAPTHLVYKEVRFHDLLEPFLDKIPELKVVAIVRDPRAVIASWVAAPREFRPKWSVDEEWRHAPSKNAGLDENWYGFSRWRELARVFLRLKAAYPDRMLLVRYEDLVADTEAKLAELFNAVGLPMTGQVRAFIERSGSVDDGAPYGVLRDRRSRSRIDLDRRICEQIEAELDGDPAAQFLARGGS